MSRNRIGAIIIAGLLILLAWWNIAAAQAGLTVRWFEKDGLPLVYLVPKLAQNVPGVLVAHGYSGSKQLMLAYGHVLAQAGYAVMLWDFDGHGANPDRLEQGSLERNIATATQAIVQQPEVDKTRLALLGHSMGSGAVMSAAIANPNQFSATIAVSPTGASVTPQLPRNLQLQSGTGEGRFVQNAERLLAAAGGANQTFKTGQARAFVLVPNVEHITILFSTISHQAARHWLDETFGTQRSSQYVDRRMLWQGIHLLGWLIGLIAISPRLKDSTSDLKVSQGRSWLGLGVSTVAAGGGLVLLNSVVDLQTLGGIQVGGAVGLWFLISGLVWLAIIGQIPRLTVRSMILGLGLFSGLWIAVGAMAQFVWLQSLLIPVRFILWLAIALAALPWFLASEILQQNSNRIVAWLGRSVIVIAGFILVLRFLPQLGFMFILLPLFPIVFGLLAVTSAQIKQAWSGAIAGSLFLAWLMAAGFPFG
ncbi:MAG: alpha/beta fold hydrolase [Leptolyngbya sp. Prado105]|jgi:pimeloyl-ACP methyl ester carboxylesterase|nr:alpha/beta fold hydrolase [Leptolyngbya sp. Prado105]